MDRIDSMGVFAKVIAKRSFSGAARELLLSQAVVSKQVRALENWLGAQLLHRTTRRLNVTASAARPSTDVEAPRFQPQAATST